MFLTVSHFFNVLAFLDLTLAILCCILLIKVPAKYSIKFVTIPLIILVTYISIIQGEDILGRPYEMKPVGQFEFLDYRVVVIDGVKKIELWIVQNKKSRLHIIEYGEKFEQEMAKAKSRKNKGARERGEFGANGKGGGRDLSIGDIPLEELLPKKEGEETAPTDPTSPRELTPEELKKRKDLFTT